MDVQKITTSFAKIGLVCLGFVWPILFISTASLAVEYGLSNAPATTEWPTPNTVIVLPSGQRIDPWVTLPEGWILSDDGSVVSEDGLILKPDGTIEYPFGHYPKGYVQKPDGTIVTPEGFNISPKAAEAKRIEKLKAESKDPTKISDPTVASKKEALKTLPKGAKVLPDGTVILPDGRTIDPKGQEVRLKKEDEQQAVKPPVVSPTKPNIVVEGNANEPVQLWSMLPLTEVPGQKPLAKQQGKVQTTPDKPKVNTEPKPQPNKKGAEKSTPAVKQEPKVEQKQKPVAQPEKPKPKPRIGEYLRIPPEAIKTGNLDFLEGCWQGTRPEYYTKRTIYECFCFGKQGSSGKRKVFDPTGGRRCVGSTSANLGLNGILNVTSSGAVCSDGERWGQAQMTCRGRGEHTPCSWVFKDANGGKQAYEIPFVRVQACGRRR